MAIYIHCPHCHKRLEVPGDHCTHCGFALPPGVALALSASLGGAGSAGIATAPSFPAANPLATLYPAATQHTPPPHHSALRPWLAAALSLIWGLGQLYNGQLYKGVALLLGGSVALLAWPWLLGQIAAGLLWCYAISDAYLVARRTLPLRPGRQDTRPRP